MSVTSVGPSLVTPVEFPHVYNRENSSPRPQAQGQRVETAEQSEKSQHETEHRQFKPQVIHSAAADLEQISLVFDKKLKFVVDHSSNEVTVKVIDRETDKVIKELPPEELQRLHNDLKETIGFLFDERV